jgi:hypothetical protein
MLEIKVIVEATGLAAAINNLATAMGGSAKVMPAEFRQPVILAAPGIPAQQQAPVNYPAPTAPMQNAPGAPVQQPAPGIPLGQAPKYTAEQIMTAGAALVDAGRVQDLMNLLNSFGVQAVAALKPEQLGAFATALREMGAKI